jgi:hypothetical protein
LVFIKPAVKICSRAALNSRQQRKANDIYMEKYILKPMHRMSFRFLFFLMGSVMFLSSCEDDEVGQPISESAPPVIEAVRIPANQDSTFTRATLGTTIVIMGKNLAGTREVYFNEFRAPVNPVYATSSNLIVRIPDEVPTAGTAESVPNVLRIVNSAGETTFEFEVLDPAPVVNAISNEFVQAGQTVTIYGTYFYQVEAVIFPNGTEEGIVVTSGINANPDGRSLTVTVPEGVDPTQGDVHVVTKSGPSGANRRTKLYSGNGMILNWDVQGSDGSYPGFGWGIDAGKQVVSSFPGIEAIDGKFAVINQAVPGGWGWNNEKVISMSNWATGRLIPAESEPFYGKNAPISNFDLKLEMAAAGGAPIDGLELLVWIPGTPAGEVQVTVPLTDFVRSTDGTWYTLSVNLANLKGSSGGLSKYSDLNPNEIRLVIQNPTSANIPAQLAIDNIRIENVIVRN